MLFSLLPFDLLVLKGECGSEYRYHYKGMCGGYIGSILIIILSGNSGCDEFHPKP